MKKLALVCAFLSFSSLAQQDCLSLSGDFTAIENAKAQGQYRFANKTKVTPISYAQDTPFDDYISAQKAQINALNPHANRPCPINNYVMQQLAISTPTVADLISPFELKQENNSKAVLLIHGLTDSPFHFHDLAAFYHQQGLTVRTLLLPGHGTAADQLRKVSYKDWQQAAYYAIERTLADFDKVYLGGFSTGGALILDYLQETKANKKLAGAMLFSPATQPKNSKAWLAGYVDWIPFVNWLDEDADLDFAKYESFPYNAAGAVSGLMDRIYKRALKNKAGTISTPLFVAIPEQDQTINSANSLSLFNHLSERSKVPMQLVYYGDKAKLAAYSALSGSNVTVTLPQCTQSSCTQKTVMAHTAITSSPSNPHYGELGVYSNCGHYLSDAEKYKSCKTTLVAQQEVTAEVLAKGVTKRLTYNPYFTQLTASLSEFLQAH
jgi:esterase/lipase